MRSGETALTAASYRALVLLSVVPGTAAFLVLARWVHERPGGAMSATPTPRLAWQGLPLRFKAYLGVLVLFTLGNSSDAFLMLRAQTVGLSPLEIFLALAGFNVVISLSATPAGALSDVIDRVRLIGLGWIFHGFIYVGFAFASEPWHIWGLYLTYGLYYGASQGASTALVADLVPAELHGTAYGLSMLRPEWRRCPRACSLVSCGTRTARRRPSLPAERSLLSPPSASSESSSVAKRRRSAHESAAIAPLGRLLRIGRLALLAHTCDRHGQRLFSPAAEQFFTGEGALRFRRATMRPARRHAAQVSHNSSPAGLRPSIHALGGVARRILGG
jgi:hypothetical protein